MSLLGTNEPAVLRAYLAGYHPTGHLHEFIKPPGRPGQDVKSGHFQTKENVSSNRPSV